MCQLCAALPASPDICPFDNALTSLANAQWHNDTNTVAQLSDTAPVVQYQAAVFAADLGLTTAPTSQSVMIPLQLALTSSETETVRALDALFEEYFNTHKPASASAPVTRPDYKGALLASNLSGPLAAIDLGWKVADQDPSTPVTDINVYFYEGTRLVVDSSYFSDPIFSKGWSSAQIAAAKVAFEQFENVANINFEFVNTPAAADFVMLTYHDSSSSDLGYFSVGDGQLRIDGTHYDVNGYGAFNINGYGWSDDGLQPGGYGYATVSHEIGHGLGLAHPHDTAGGTSTVMSGVSAPFGDYGTASLNQGVWTVMSYNDGWPEGPGGKSNSPDYGHTAGIMALDMAVVQDTFGANTTFANGNNIYTLPTGNTNGTGYHAIWDTGGTDTIQAATNGTSAVIDLRAATLDYSTTGGGSVSYTKGVIGGFTIANNVVIENAIGSTGHDVLIGNMHNNVLDGRGGDDTITGGLGADTFVFRHDTTGTLPSSRATITDFADGVDTLQFNGFAHTTANAFVAQYASQQSNNVVFTLTPTDSITVESITVAQLTDDIAFV